MEGNWIEQYGYLAVFVAGLLEGETAFIIAGYAASRGYLDPIPTFLTAAAAGATGDLMYYLLGRRYGRRLIRTFPSLRKLRARAVLLIRRWGRATAFLTRFAYGLRSILPMSLGAARMRFPVFITFNLMGSLSFAAVYLTLGYLFGETVQEILQRVRPYEKWILGGLVALGVTVWAAREWKLFHPKPEEVIPPAKVEEMEEEVRAELSGEEPRDEDER